MREFFIEHRTVDLSLDREDEPPLRQRETLCEAVENSLFRHPRKMLGINLDGILSRGRSEWRTGLVGGRTDVRHERSDVHESCDLRVVASLTDYSAAPRVAHEDDRAILHSDDTTGRVDIVR